MSCSLWPTYHAAHAASDQGVYLVPADGGEPLLVAHCTTETMANRLAGWLDELIRCQALVAEFSVRSLVAAAAREHPDDLLG